MRFPARDWNPAFDLQRSAIMHLASPRIMIQVKGKDRLFDFSVCFGDALARRFYYRPWSFQP